MPTKVISKKGRKCGRTMKQIKVELNEIERLRYAMKETKSICLKQDYRKKGKIF